MMTKRLINYSALRRDFIGGSDARIIRGRKSRDPPAPGKCARDRKTCRPTSSSYRDPYPPSSAARPQLFGFPLLWAVELLAGVLVEDMQHGGGETADGLRPRRQVRLFATPVVQALQKFTREPHLKRPILNASRWAPHKCIDLYSKCHYIYQAERVVTTSARP
jgi:hypothetical protein